jgi:F0F1-type ATP synthase assembly protein I
MKRAAAAFRMIGVGWYIGLCIVLGLVGGLWLDNKFNTKPFLTIAGLILGLVVAIYGVYRILVPLLSDKNKKENS